MEPLQEAAIREIIADGYYLSRDYPSALPHRERVHELRLTGLGEGHGDTLKAMFKLGASYQHVGKDARAPDVFSKAVDITTRGGRRTDLSVAPILLWVGASRYQAEGRYAEAQRMLELLARIEDAWGRTERADAHRKHIEVLRKWPRQPAPQ